MYIIISVLITNPVIENSLKPLINCIKMSMDNKKMQIYLISRLGTFV